MHKKERREAYRAGLIASKIDNLFRKKTDEAIQPLDYFPKFQKPKERLDYRLEKRKATENAINIATIVALDTLQKAEGK